MDKKDNKLSESFDFYDKLANTLPEFFARNSVDKLTGGVFSGRYLSNLNAKKIGPKGTRIGNKVVIFREDFISWLRSKYDN